MELVLLSGFLGAGKTTLMLAAADIERARGRRVAVVVNDQGTDLVDRMTADAGGGPDVAEVTDGCFCCRYDDLAGLLRRLADDGVELVIAEAVGSCTDLAATVIGPLQRFTGLSVAPLTTVVDPRRMRELAGQDGAVDTGSDLGYLFDRQLAEAEIVAVNKTDVIDPGARAAARADIQARHPRVRVQEVSARTGDGLPALIAAWARARSAAGPAVLDYDRYAAAEASLGWLNQRWRLSGRTPFDPGAWCRSVLDHLDRLWGDDVLVGHVKIAVRSPAGFTRAALIGSGHPAHVQHRGTDTPVRTADAVVNVRARVAPAAVETAVATAVLAGARAVGGDGPDRVSAIAEPARAFAPAYPRPTHRVRPTHHAEMVR